MNKMTTTVTCTVEVMRSDITKPSYNKVNFGSSLYFFVYYPDIMRNLI